MKHIYHYFAVKFDGCDKVTIDGILTFENEILTMEDYRRAKKLIFETDDLEGCVVESLSKLETTQKGGTMRKYIWGLKSEWPDMAEWPDTKDWPDTL